MIRRQGTALKRHVHLYHTSTLRNRVWRRYEDERMTPSAGEKLGKKDMNFTGGCLTKENNSNKKETSLWRHGDYLPRLTLYSFASDLLPDARLTFSVCRRSTYYQSTTSVFVVACTSVYGLLSTIWARRGHHRGSSSI